jgi:hypothetical protein
MMHNEKDIYAVRDFDVLLPHFFSSKTELIGLNYNWSTYYINAMLPAVSYIVFFQYFF